MKEELFQLAIRSAEQEEIGRMLACNKKLEAYGLTLREEDAKALLANRTQSLQKHERVEFAESILPKLIFAFFDSAYLSKEEYIRTVGELLDVFYLFKNESGDRLTDDELLAFMREQFDNVCFGSVEYLAETCLDRFARAIRAGYRGYEASQGAGEYEQFSEETRWEKELYDAALRELIF
ncbi:DUF6323 family protein [Beduinella massiliensis]|uniref:DUF6323 family protein n=1 Tax=Beduinella massiliensis TaxID=1852363 RepID=UPI000C85D74C